VAKFWPFCEGKKSFCSKFEGSLYIMDIEEIGMGKEKATRKLTIDGYF
jgi:hypothetical protein